jgi:flagellar brake protein
MDEHMIVEQLPDANGIDPSAPERPEYGRRDPRQIALYLRNLADRGDFVTIEYGGKQLATQLLDVDLPGATFVFDRSSNEAENQALLNAGKLVFRGAPDGVRIEFKTGAPVETSFEGRPAFKLGFPEILYCVQRREYFRVETPILEPYFASGKYPGGNSFRYEIHDLSLGGLALRTLDQRIAETEIGCVLEDVKLNFGKFGLFSIDLQLVSPRSTITTKGDRRYIVGFKFVDLPGSGERTLQRLITHLDVKRRSLVSR